MTTALSTAQDARMTWKRVFDRLNTQLTAEMMVIADLEVHQWTHEQLAQATALSRACLLVQLAGLDLLTHDDTHDRTRR